MYTCTLVQHQKDWLIIIYTHYTSIPKEKEKSDQ